MNQTEARLREDLAQAERELRDARRMVAILLLKSGGTAIVTRLDLVAVEDDTVIEMIERPIAGDWVISAKAPQRG